MNSEAEESFSHGTILIKLAKWLQTFGQQCRSYSSLSHYCDIIKMNDVLAQTQESHQTDEQPEIVSGVNRKTRLRARRLGTP